jgi:hypothetical protein
MIRRFAVLPTAAFILSTTALLAAPRAAAAQTAGQERSTIGASKGGQVFSVKGKFSVFGAVGLDLDVIGDVTVPALGVIRGTQVSIQGTAYPDVYVKTQHRRYAGLSYGFKRKTEILARYQSANNPAATVAAGDFGTATNDFPVAFDTYKDRMFEFGLRHYMATPKHTRQYFSLLYGLKTVEAIGMDMQAPGGSVRTALYSQSRIPSIGLEFGLALEKDHFSIFLESGVRWQKKLTRDDTELTALQMTGVNDTGARLFMPATLGLHFRF